MLAKALTAMTAEGREERGTLTGRIVFASVFEDLNVGGDLLACPDLVCSLKNVVRYQLIAPTGLSIDKDLSPSEFRDDF